MTCWITDRLATCAYNERPSGDFVLIDVRHLVDKSGNSSAAVADCIQRGASSLKKGDKVIVACDFGVSRSNSIAAGILSVSENCTLDDAVSRVIAATGETEIKLDMVQSVREALSAGTPRARPATTLITGGSGFLGRHLVPLLAPTHRVVAPERGILDLKDGAVKLAAYCQAADVAQIVHLAYPRVYTNVSAMADGLAMLRTILDTCKRLDIRLIFVSGSVIFGGYVTSHLIADESLPLRPRGAYSDAKFLEEMLVAAYYARGEIRRSICRLSPVYGAGGDRPRLINAFRERLSADRELQTHRYRNGRPALDLLYVTDAADAIARTVAHDADDVFHFGSGSLHRTVEIAEQIAGLLKKKLRYEELLIDDDIANIQMDSRKALDILGWSPGVLLQEGLARCLGTDV